MAKQEKHSSWLATTTAAHEEVERLIRAEHSDPFHILGAHPVKLEHEAGVAIRALLPGAASVEVIREGAPPKAMERIHPEGFFETTFPGAGELFRYRLRMKTHDGVEREFDDPYRFSPILSEFDLHLFGEGAHYRTYDKLGAHVMECEGVRGAGFAVWAPNAERVSVVGDFNGWDGRVHAMRGRGATGLWEHFIPGLGEGAIYKYEIKPRGGGPPLLKADPYAFRAEVRPKTASIVSALDGYAWGDEAWMEQRARRQGLEGPIAIYEVHLGSWRRSQGKDGLMNYRELARDLVAYVTRMGFTHVELLPVMEHPLDESWGYQTTGYFAPTSRFGPPEDFMYFVDYCHQHGVGVILDWAPAHFPSDAHGLAEFDGTHLYDHADPRRGEHKDWGTRIFNYGRTEVRNFLLSSALFWLDRYHADGLRVDAVASMLYLDYSRQPGEWIPNAYGGNEDLDAMNFIKQFNEQVHLQHPGVLTIAEESTAWPGVSRPTYAGGLGFSLKWNLGWMHDTLLYFSKDALFRRYHHNNLTFSLLYAFTENFVLVLSHDEVVHGKRALISKMPGDDWQRFANLRALYAYLYAHPGKKLLFMGGEFGQWDEWNAAKSLDWHLLESAAHQGIARVVARLNALLREEPPLHQVDFDYRGFEWIDFQDVDQSVIAFLRRGAATEDFVVVICNFTPVPREGYRIGVPEAGTYREILNTDAAEFGGSGFASPLRVTTIDAPWQNRPCTLELTLPPLAVVFLKLERR